MKKNYFLTLLVFLMAQITYSQCTMNLRMYDDYGDGWNGNTMTVTVNGSAVITSATLTGPCCSTTGPVDVSFTASTGDTVRTIWNGGGSYGYEVGYEIISNDGTVLFSENMSSVGVPAGLTTPTGNSGNNLAVCPSCPAPSGLTASAVTDNSATISWTSVPALGFGIEYDTSGFTLGTGTQTTSATPSINLTGLSANTSYDFYVIAVCAVGDTSTIAGPYSFSTICDTASIPYLQDFSTWPPTCFDMTGGTNSWLSYTGGIAEANFWSVSSGDFFMTTEPVLISANSRLKFDWSYTYNTSYQNDSVSVQVREGAGPWTTLWGGKGAALDAADGGGNTSPGTFSTATIILDSATYTNKVIQVRFVGVSGYGPDFFLDNIIIEAVPNCPEPLMLGAHNITSTSADVNWTNPAGSASFRLEYGPAGFTQGTGTSSVETNDTVSLSGLTSFTTYDFYVTSICTPTDSSPWSGPYTFTTLCSDTNLGPWMDDVEGHASVSSITGIGNCWSGTKSGTSFEWEITNSGTTGSSNTGALSANSGTNYFYTEASGAGASDTTTLVSPSVDLASLTTPFLEFYYHMFGAQMGTLHVEVYDGTSWTNELTLTGQQQATQASPWNQQYIDLSTYSGVIKLRFRAVSNGSYEGDICLDDIAVIESPACFPPSMAAVSGTINDSTTATWMAPAFGTPTKYYIQYGATGFTPGTGTIDSTTTTMIGIGGLMASTTYDYYVRSYCGGTDSSAWVGPVTFTTQCDPDMPTYSQDFASYLPTCWEEANGVLSTTSNVVPGNSDWIADGFGNVGTTGAARMNIYSTGRNDWLISNPIDLGDGSVPYQVEFDVALTNYASTGPDNMGVDDTLAFVISTDYGATWSSANALRVWQAGDQPANAGERVFFDLSAYTGVVKFGFYGASSVSNADYDVHIDNFLVTNLCVPDTMTYTDTACGTYTSPSGKIWTMPGTYYDTLQKARGCDSLFVITLVVNNTTSTISETACDSYTSPSGKMWTTSGMYMDTITNSIGCDSIITINLTVNYSVSVTDVVTVCDRYTLPDGYVTQVSGTFLDTIPTSKGCDSIVTTSVTVNYTTNSSISATVCGSYTSPSGKVWTTSGTRLDTIPNSMGCDSLMRITITVKSNTTETRTISACDTYTVPETGSVYTTSGTYTDVITNAYGCSHTITTVLTVNTATAGAVTVSGITLTSSNTGVSYKWMDCDNDYSYLLGETSQSFTPIRNGNYAVEIETADGCKDTSACTMIMSVSLDEYQVSADDISVYPNPSNDQVTIDIAKLNANENVMVNMYDAVGKLVYSRELSSVNSKVVFDVSTIEAGVYSVSVSNDYFVVTKKVTVIK